MIAIMHFQHNRGENLEVIPLTRQQWVLLKVREYSDCQLGNATHFVFDGAVTTIRSNETAFKDSLKDQQDFGAIRILADGKAGTYVPTELVTLAFVERHAKAAFTVSVA